MPRLLALSSLVLTVACSDASEPPAADAEPPVPKESSTASPEEGLSKESEAAQRAIAEHLNMSPGEHVNLSIELSPNTQSHAVARAPVGGLCVAALRSPEGQWMVTYMGTTAPPSEHSLHLGGGPGTMGGLADQHEVTRMFDRCLASNSPRPD